MARPLRVEFESAMRPKRDRSSFSNNGRSLTSLSRLWTWKVLPRCPGEITSRRFRKQIIAWRRDYASHRHSFRPDCRSRGFGGGEGCRATSGLWRRSAFTAQCGRRGSSGQASGRRHHAAVLGPGTTQASWPHMEPISSTGVLEITCILTMGMISSSRNQTRFSPAAMRSRQGCLMRT